MRKLYFIWAASLCVKLFITYFIPLSFDEAYYWVWSKNLQLSYYDHPPMVAWLFKIGSIFEGFGHAVRWPHVLVGHLTLLVWIHILKEYFSFEKIRAWVWLALFSSLVGFGSLVATPDVAVMLFWSLAFYSFQRILLNYDKKIQLRSLSTLPLAPFLV